MLSYSDLRLKSFGIRRLVVVPITVFWLWGCGMIYNYYTNRNNAIEIQDIIFSPRELRQLVFTTTQGGI